MTSPDKGSGNNYLNGVSCASSALCMGAGDCTAASLDRTLIEKWQVAGSQGRARRLTGAGRGLRYLSRPTA